jgi:hypothetical protein
MSTNASSKVLECDGQKTRRRQTREDYAAGSIAEQMLFAPRRRHNDSLICAANQHAAKTARALHMEEEKPVHVIANENMDRI